MKHELKIHLWEGTDGEIEGHVDLPADGTFTFEAMKVVFEEFCRSNKYHLSAVVHDFCDFVAFEEDSK